MTITQTVEIPANRRLSIEVPREVPTGPVVLAFMPKAGQRADADIEKIRRLLYKEMAEQGTLSVIAATGGGWEAHVREHYAES